MKMQMTEEQKAEYFAEKCRHTQKVESDRDRIKVLESIIAKGHEDRRFTAAVAALQGIVSAIDGYAVKDVFNKKIVDTAIQYADALLAELDKGET